MAEALTALLGSIGSVGTSAISWMGSILTFITGNAALTICVIALPVFGYGVGLLRRLFSVN